MAEVLASLTFTLVGNSYAVTGCGNITTCTKIVIPSTYNDKPVTQLGYSMPVFNGGQKIKSVFIPDSITSISTGVFANCNITADSPSMRIVINANVSQLSSMFLSSNSKVGSVVCQWQNPPIMSGAFPSTASIIVPKQYENVYKKALGWSQYNIIGKESLYFSFLNYSSSIKNYIEDITANPTAGTSMLSMSNKALNETIAIPTSGYNQGDILSDTYGNIALVERYESMSTYAKVIYKAPTIGNGTITINQGGTQKGTFTVNQTGSTTINLDAGGGGGDSLYTITTISDWALIFSEWYPDPTGSTDCLVKIPELAGLEISKLKDPNHKYRFIDPDTGSIHSYIERFIQYDTYQYRIPLISSNGDGGTTMAYNTSAEIWFRQCDDGHGNGQEILYRIGVTVSGNVLSGDMMYPSEIRLANSTKTPITAELEYPIVRIANLDTGIYRLNYTNSAMPYKVVYYGGTTDTSRYEYLTSMAGGSVLLHVNKIIDNNSPIWNWYCISEDNASAGGHYTYLVYGSTTMTSGESHYIKLDDLGKTYTHHFVLGDYSNESGGNRKLEFSISSSSPQPICTDEFCNGLSAYIGINNTVNANGVIYWVNDAAKTPIPVFFITSDGNGSTYFHKSGTINYTSTDTTELVQDGDPTWYIHEESVFENK